MKKEICKRLMAIGMALMLITPAVATEIPGSDPGAGTVITTEAPKATDQPRQTEAPVNTETPKETKPADTEVPVQTKAAETENPVQTTDVETTVPTQTETAVPTDNDGLQTTAPADTEQPQTTVPSETTPADPQNTAVAPGDTENPGSTATAAPESTATAGPKNTSAPDDAEKTDNANVPDSTDQPSSTETADPNATVDPDATQDPNTTIDPDVTTDPSTTVDPNATEEPEAALNEGTTIVVFAPIAIAEASVEAKPSLEEVLAKLETVLTATLDDDSTVSVPVVWTCADYDAEAIQYIFTSALTDTAYALAEGLNMPVFVLHIVEPTQLVSGDFTCDIREDGSLIVVAWSGTSETVTVPASLEGRPVWGVANAAFANNDKLTEISIADGILALEEGAFANCPKLKKINLPDSLEYAGGGLFGGSDPEYIQLNISRESEISDERGYRREEVIQNADGTTSIREINVSIDRDFTDYAVLSGGKWRIRGPLTILSGHTAIVSSGGAMAIDEDVTVTVFGSLACAGASVNSGVVAACSGAASGVDGTVLREHSWQGTECRICGARQSAVLTARLASGEITKVYDGSNAIDIGPEDFILDGVYESDDVRISAINADFGSKNVGNYLVSVSLVLGGEDAAYYSVLPLELTVSITKKAVTVTPREGQSKVYGDKDPSLRAGYRGVVSGETLSGKLSRESGENAGRYKITMGTLVEKNPNYEIVLGEGVFTIEPKALTNASVSVAAVSNQRYTGAAIAPSVEVMDGGKTLKAGVDYDVTYTDNTDVGTAKAIITGKGNYTGERAAAFRIIKVGSSSGSGFAGGSVMPDADPGDFDESYEDQQDGTLDVAGDDQGSILFDGSGNALPFVQYDQEITRLNPETGLEEVAQKILHIEAQETVDAFGIENRGDYADPHMRLPMETVHSMISAGYSDVYLNVGEAQLRIPLSTLYSEYVGSGATLQVDAYEFRLWPEIQPYAEDLQNVLAEYNAITAPVHVEILALPETVQQDENGAYAGAEDVMSLLDGVMLMFTPAEEPNYQYTEYYTICVPSDAAAPAPQTAEFIMEDDEVKGRIMPMFGGSYVIGAKNEK